MNEIQVPPQQIEAEQGILGAILLEGDEKLVEAMDLVTDADFYRSEHKLIFQTAKTLFSEGSGVDLITVTERLMRDGQIEQAGNAVYLSSLIESVPMGTNVAAYAEIVGRQSIWRRLIQAGERLQEYGYRANGREPDEIIGNAVNYLLGLTCQRVDTAKELKDILPNVLAGLDRSRAGELLGLSTGFYDLDRLCLGLQPGCLYIVAGRPGMGKTALALNMAQHIGQTHKTLIFSLEMSKESLALRMLVQKSRVHGYKVRSGKITDAEHACLLRSAPALPQHLVIDDDPYVDIIGIRARALKYRPQAIFADYLQLMKSTDKRQSEEKQIAEISRGLKLLARELGIPVVALAQLNRECEKRHNKRPMLSDLRGSGSIEQDADAVVFLYRDEEYNKETEYPHQAELIMAKQREGATATIRLRFDAACVSFGNLQRD